MHPKPAAEAAFTSYQKLLIAILALLQFTVVLDFMVLSPLGDILMKSLTISPSGFGLVGIVMSFAATLNGLLSFRMSEFVVRYAGEFLEKGEKRKAEKLKRERRLMIRRLDKLWYGLLCRAHVWIMCLVAAHSRRELVRNGKAKPRGESVDRLVEHLAGQKPHLN